MDLVKGCEILSKTEIVLMASHLAISGPQLKEIQQATSEDETLKEVMKVIIEGWPACKSTPIFSYQR